MQLIDQPLVIDSRSIRRALVSCDFKFSGKQQQRFTTDLTGTAVSAEKLPLFFSQQTKLNKALDFLKER